jgi:hypothetical protein
MTTMHETRRVKASDLPAGHYVWAGLELGSLLVLSSEFNGSTATIRLESDDKRTQVTAVRNPADEFQVEIR